MTLPPDMQWMDWDGWRWVGFGLALVVGFGNGWAWRGVREANRDLRAAIENSVSASTGLVSKISTFTDPRLSSDSVEEMEVWAQIVREAKAIAGDNSIEDEEDAPDAR